MGAVEPPNHPVATPRGAAAFAVIVGLAGVFAPVFLDAKGAIAVGLLAACVIGWIYWREARQAWRERRWHTGLIFVVVLTFATAKRLTGGGKDQNTPVLCAIANLKRDLDSSNTVKTPPGSSFSASHFAAVIAAPYSRNCTPGARGAFVRCPNTAGLASASATDRRPTLYGVFIRFYAYKMAAERAP